MSFGQQGALTVSSSPGCTMGKSFCALNFTNRFTNRVQRHLPKKTKEKNILAIMLINSGYLEKEVKLFFVTLLDKDYGHPVFF